MSEKWWSGFRWLLDKVADGFVLADKVKGIFGGDADGEIDKSTEGVDPEAKILLRTIKEKQIQLENLRKETYRTNSNVIKQLWAKMKINYWFKDSNLREMSKLESEIAAANDQLQQIMQDNQNKTRAETDSIMVGNEAKRAEDIRTNQAHIRSMASQDMDLNEKQAKIHHEEELRTLERTEKFDEITIKTLENKIRLLESQEKYDALMNNTPDPTKQIEKKILLLEKQKQLKEFELNLLETQKKINELKNIKVDPQKQIKDSITEKKFELEKLTIDQKIAYQKKLWEDAWKDKISPEKQQILNNRITNIEKQIAVLIQERNKITNDRSYINNKTALARIQEIEKHIGEYNENITNIINTMP